MNPIIQRTALGVLLGIWLATALSFVMITILPPVLSCNANPYGYTCPAWMGPAVFLGIPGLITAPASLLIALIWGLPRIASLFAGRR